MGIQRITASAVAAVTGGITAPGRYAPPPKPARAEDPHLHDTVRTLALASAACLVVIRFSMLHELLTYVFNVRVFLQYVFGIPALLGLAVTGGFQRIFRGRTALYWTAYACWMFAAVPFSIWKGGSFRVAWAYMRAEFVILLMIAGLIVTWRECGIIMRAIAWGGIILLGCGRFFQTAESRLGLTYGTVANPNDYACVLLLTLPFAFWMLLTSRRVVVRFIMLVALGYGAYIALSTASRGALIGLAVELLIVLMLATPLQRLAILLLGAVAAFAIAAALPSDIRERITAFSDDATSATGKEAAESMSMRRYALRKAVEYSIQHPAFGVGPGRFSEYEGQNNETVGAHGYWINAHNTFLQASSECGLPALGFMAAGALSTLLSLIRTRRKARRSPLGKDIQVAAMCVTAAFAGFLTGVTFLNFAYTFYLPAMAGLAIAMGSAADRELEIRGAAA